MMGIQQSVLTDILAKKRLSAPDLPNLGIPAETVELFMRGKIGIDDFDDAALAAVLRVTERTLRYWQGVSATQTRGGNNLSDDDKVYSDAMKKRRLQGF